MSFPFLLFRRPILVRLNNGLKFYVANFTDVWVLKEIVLEREYEQLTTVKKGDLVIDIGAGIGDFSIIAGKNAGKVYAYEPDENRIDLIKENLKINGCKNIEINTQKVQSLNEVFAPKGIEHCDFLKIDCEGCEYTIFKNTNKSYLNKIGFIAMEVHFFNEEMKKQYKELISLLTAYFQIKEVSHAVSPRVGLVFAYSEPKGLIYRISDSL